MFFGTRPRLKSSSTTKRPKQDASLNIREIFPPLSSLISKLVCSLFHYCPETESTGNPRI